MHKGLNTEEDTSNFQASEIEGVEEKSLTRLLEFFKTVESFIKIQMRSGNGRRHYTSLWKIKIMIAMDEKQWMSYKSLHF